METGQFKDTQHLNPHMPLIVSGLFFAVVVLVVAYSFYSHQWPNKDWKGVFKVAADAHAANAGAATVTAAVIPATAASAAAADSAASAATTVAASPATASAAGKLAAAAAQAAQAAKTLP